MSRSTDFALDGRHSFRVWSNKFRSPKSNHVIGANKVASSGRTGKWRYQAYAMIPAETARTGQTGPEFSMQNTRQIAPGQFRTMIAGIQYQASPYLPPNWAIWREVAPGQASWFPFLKQPLAAYNVGTHESLGY